MYHPNQAPANQAPVIARLNSLRNEIMGCKLSAAKKTSIANAIQNIQTELLTQGGLSPNTGARHYQQQTPFPNPKMDPYPSPNIGYGHNPHPIWGYSMGPSGPNHIGSVGMTSMTPNMGSSNSSTFASIPPMRPQEPIQIPMPGNYKCRVRNVVFESEMIKKNIEVYRASPLAQFIIKDDEEKIHNRVLKVIGSQDEMDKLDNEYRDVVIADQATDLTHLVYLFTKVIVLETIRGLITFKYEIEGYSNNLLEINFELQELNRMLNNICLRVKTPVKAEQ